MTGTETIKAPKAAIMQALREFGAPLARRWFD